jgi:hypothetical protein
MEAIQLFPARSNESFRTRVGASARQSAGTIAAMASAAAKKGLIGSSSFSDSRVKRRCYRGRVTRCLTPRIPSRRSALHGKLLGRGSWQAERPRRPNPTLPHAQPVGNGCEDCACRC